MSTVDAFTNAELVAAARRSLSDPAWNRLVGAAESETTARRNRMALDSIALRPRVLVGVTDVDPSVRMLGHHLRLPILLANIGDPELLWPGGAGAVAGAASQLGIPRLVAPRLPPDGRQGRTRPDRACASWRYRPTSSPTRFRGLASDAEQMGCAAVCVSLVPHGAGRREREPHTPAPLPRRTRDAWSVVDLALSRSRLPVMVKGVMGATDALTAIEHGCAAIYVSNYGGRALDHCEGTIDALAEVAEVAAGRAEIIVDGGFMRGTDVIKALATGAGGVAVGRLQGLALAAGGGPGLVRALEILEEELRVSLALLGATSIDALSGSHLFRDVPPVEFPTETSALLPPGRRSGRDQCVHDDLGRSSSVLQLDALLGGGLQSDLRSRTPPRRGVIVEDCASRGRGAGDGVDQAVQLNAELLGGLVEAVVDEPTRTLASYCPAVIPRTRQRGVTRTKSEPCFGGAAAVGDHHLGESRA